MPRNLVIGCNSSIVSNTNTKVVGRGQSRKDFNMSMRSGETIMNTDILGKATFIVVLAHQFLYIIKITVEYRSWDSKQLR